MCDCGRYKLYNLESNRGRVTAIENGTCVKIGNREKIHLDAQDVYDISTLQSGDILSSCKPIFGSGELGSAGFEMVPDWWKSDTFGTTRSRYGGVRFEIYSIDATSIQIFRNKGLNTTLTLTPGQVTTFTQTGAYTGSWDLIANGNVVITGRDDNGAGDSSVISIPDNNIIGWASTAAYIASADPPPTVVFTAYNREVSVPFVGNIATTYNIVNQIDFVGITGAMDNYYDPRVGLRAIGPNLYGESRADSDGGNHTPFIPLSRMTTHHVIPQPTEFISFISDVPTTVQWFDENGVAQPSIVLTKNSIQANAPYAARIGTPNNASNFPAGQLFIGSNPVHIVYQTKGAGIYGSDDDELISIGYNL